MPEENEQHHGHQHAAKHERVLDALERLLDERRGPVQAGEYFDAFAFEDRLHFLKCFLEFVCGLERVRAELTRERKQHAGPALHQAVAELRLRALDHIRHIAQSHGHAVLVRHDDFAEHGGRERLALGLDEDALVLRLDEPRAAHARREPRRREHILQTEVVRDEPVGLHLNLQLPHFAAERDAARDAGHGKQTRLERPVRERAQLHRRKFFRDEADLEQVHRGRHERRHRGRGDADGQLRCDRAELLREQLPRGQNIRALLEHHRDDRQALDGFAAQRFEIAKAIHRRFDGPRDERLDLLGRHARGLRLHRHLRRHEVGKHIELRVLGDVEAVEEHDARERNHDAAMPEGEADDAVQHWIRKAEAKPI